MLIFKYVNDNVQILDLNSACERYGGNYRATT